MSPVTIVALSVLATLAMVALLVVGILKLCGWFSVDEDESLRYEDEGQLT